MSLSSTVLFKTRYAFIALMLCVCSKPVVAQMVLTQEEAVQRALTYHPSVKAAASYEKAHIQLEKSAFSLPSPAVSVQSPTGEFYTVGVTQNIDFPTVYYRQKKVLRAETALAASNTVLTKDEIMWQVKDAYAYAQYMQSRIIIMRENDNLLHTLSINAHREFEAGQIDFIQQSFAELQYGKMHQQYLEAENELQIALSRLRSLCDIKEEITVLPWSRELLSQMLTINAGNGSIPALLTVAQNERLVAEVQVSLEKSRAMPGIQLGYMNQGLRNTPMDLRFMAGITIPLWFWQYSAKIRAAKANAEGAAENEKMIALDYERSLSESQSQLQQQAIQLGYYLQSALKNVDELQQSSLRFFESGETDLTSHLRILGDVLQVKLAYLESAHSYTSTLIKLQYLNGNH